MDLLTASDASCRRRMELGSAAKGLSIRSLSSAADENTAASPRWSRRRTTIRKLSRIPLPASPHL